MNRKLIAAIVVIIAVCIGIYFWTEWEKARFDASLPKPPAEDTAGGHWHGDEWHAEPHVADEVEEEDTGPFLYEIMLPELTELKPGEIRYSDAAKTKPIHWMNYGGIVPDENTPRPYKHLTNEEVHTMDRTGLTPVQQVLLENEIYFRYPLSRETLKLSQEVWKSMEERDRRNEQRNARAIREYQERRRERQQSQN